ncbi:hypothetical protein ATCC90586_008520 [Pythium insidiosum]|nr:hypothetical protein ATCC90586_008520 [Pythium insidiosum]
MAPPPSLSPPQLAAIHRAIVACTVLSALGCLYVLLHHFRLRRHTTPTPTQTMVAILAVVDLSFAVPKTFGHPGTRDMLRCNLQGFALSIVGLSTVLWNVCMAHSIYRQIVCRESEARLQRRLPVYVAATIVPAVSAAALQWALGMMGDAAFYCWLRDRVWHIVFLYVWVLLAIIYIAAVMFLTQRHLNQRARLQGNLEAYETSASITWQLRAYVVVFAVMWLPSVVFRLASEHLGAAYFPLAITMQCLLCSLGFVTSIIYGGLLRHPLRLCHRWLRMSHSDADKEYRRALSPPPFPSSTTNLQILHGMRQPVGLFVSTFNMGEGSISADELAKWIPRGYDIYVIGVQECLQLQELRQMLRRRIEGDEHSAQRAGARGSSARARFVRYKMFCREIGSTTTTLGYHVRPRGLASLVSRRSLTRFSGDDDIAQGYIALTVFVRLRDVTSGAFFMAPTSQQEVNCGMALPFGQRASNKGAVGLGFRYFDTSFAFVTCHLASDLKGKSHVLKRNRDAAEVLQSLHLSGDDLGFEFPLMHHHTIVLGDLNYRLRQHGASPPEILELVASARANFDVERHLISSWSSRARLVKSRRAIMGRAGSESSFVLADSVSVASPQHSQDADVVSSVDQVNASGYSRYSGRDADATRWEDVLRHDELRHLLSSSEVFFGFAEPAISFDPTFRRIRGRSLPSARDSALSVAELSEFYTTALDGRGERVPSYTDRILHYSQPDMRTKLRCSLYTAVERVTCSDHKPVAAVFHTVIDRDCRPLLHGVDGESRPRMQDVQGVMECTLSIVCASLTWHSDAAANESEKRHQTLRVTVMFPLPSEDIFSEQRRLHVLAARLCGGVFGNEASPLKMDPKCNVVSVSIERFLQQGLTHSTLARPAASAMHVALKIHSDDVAATCVGQGVIGLPSSLLEGSDERAPFQMPLAVGGRLVGCLSGTVALTLKPPTDAVGDSPQSV